jgi:hypothetical protein
MIKGARVVDRAPNASKYRMRDTFGPKSQSTNEMHLSVAISGWDGCSSRDRGGCSSFASLRRRLG